MKRIFCVVFTAILFSSAAVLAQGKLTSENLENQEKDLDSQYLKLTKAMEEIIKRYDLLNLKDVRFVPFQIDYEIGSNYLSVGKHAFIRSDDNPKQIVGYKTKTVKIYTDGKTVSKLEAEVVEKMYFSGEYEKITVVDPSPTTAGTDDILFTHLKKGRYILKDKKMSEIKNNTVYPIRNDLKRYFLISNIGLVNSTLITIAETYLQSVKDTDGSMFEVLKATTRY